MVTRALFLDRDGVINEDTAYVGKREEFHFLPGIFALVRTARQLGYHPIVVTNQAGIARGYYTEANFIALTNWMLDEFERNRAPIERVYHCPHHPEKGLGAYRRTCTCRKPNPGMLLRARDELGIDLSHSVLIGDKGSDVEAGRRAGVEHLIFLKGNYPYEPEADVVEISGLEEAAELLQALEQ